MFYFDNLIYEKVVNYFSSLGNSFGVSGMDVALLFFSVILFFFVKVIYGDKKKGASK